MLPLDETGITKHAANAGMFLISFCSHDLLLFVWGVLKHSWKVLNGPRPEDSYMPLYYGGRG